MDPFCVSIASPLVLDLEASHAVLSRLNALNHTTPFTRSFLDGTTIFAATEVSASPFIAAHVIAACRLIWQTAGNLDEVLQQELGGRTALGEFRSKDVH